MSSRDPSPPRRHYYSVRAGKRPADEGFTLSDFKRFFREAFSRLEANGLFQEWFGYDCVDDGGVSGKAGLDPSLYVFRKLRRNGPQPVLQGLDTYTEDDLFDIIEFLYDHSSEGIEGYHHQSFDCGWHYKSFDGRSGREIFRREMNDILVDYGSGFELSHAGEILALPDDEFAPMLAAELPHADAANIREKVEAAKLKYRRRALSERRDAVRDLADILEFLRQEAKTVLNSKDEADLFNLANNFGIRHHNKDQKTDYDQSIWLSWAFYYYLATIHACVRLIEKAKN
ncbi:hypothetical protein [Paraburkholderia sp.]|uniref:hypothetical protein n=1 Tax=Paraburkholderia sp. TaxID=1926495 RepID=UPI0023A1147A|nr:hypothetical protein [Paraburkholderia sp.]MDE1183578.1 hypothetical protein [Paraburkholderia sp.]